MNLLYEACGCGHITLADTPEGEFSEVIEDMLREIYAGALLTGQIHLGYYRYVAGKLSEAVAEGLGGVSFGADDYRNTLKAYMDQNIYAFSGARSLAMRQHYGTLLNDGKGEVRSWPEFLRKVKEVDATYNVVHLEAEYHHAIASSQMAEKWEKMQEFSALEYRTVGDDRVRPEHRRLDGLILATTDPLWRTIYPPNDWACRCTVVPAATTDKHTDQGEAVKRVKAAQVKPYFKNNVGEDKVVFSDGHPYIRKAGEQKLRELDAVKHYNLPSGERIYDMQKLPAFTPLPDRAAADSWWENMAGEKRGSFTLKSADGVSVTFDRGFKGHVLDDNKDSRHRILHQSVEVLKNPDEIWAVRSKGVLRKTYIKFFEGSPVILGVDEARAVTLYEVKKGDKINYKALGNKRQGTLMHKK